MKRFDQIILIVATLAFSWLAMQAVHELGHVFGTMISGGRIAEVVLHPSTISYTRMAENPHPLLVSWMGPLVGVSLPLIAWAIAKWRRLPGWYIVQFFAGFCLIANGAYLAFGSIESVGDAGDLVRYGAPLLLLWLFGLTTISFGLWLWNGLGRHFGLGNSIGEVRRTAAYTMLALLIVALALELVLFG
jgi:hypothetical protein